MSFVYTKNAAEVFNPVDGSSNPRGADMAEAQTWGTEVETAIDILSDGDGDGVSVMSRVRVIDTIAGDPSADYAAGGTVDGVTLDENDLILRATSGGNVSDGVYLVPSSGAASRLTAFSAYDSMPGCYFSVMEGTTYEDSLWNCISDKGGTLGSTALVFSEFNGGTVDSVNGHIGAVVLDFSDIGTREKLAANRTYYVRTDGSDSNNGLANTAGGAFLTIAYAVTLIMKSLDRNGHDVTIQVGNGTYTDTILIDGDGGGVGLGATTNGMLIIIGDETTPTNVVISTTAQCVLARNGATVSLRGMKFTNTSGNSVHVVDNARVLWQNVNFGASGAAAGHVTINQGGYVAATGDYTISGSAQWHINPNRCGLATIRTYTITLSGTPAFGTAFVWAETGGVALMDALTFSGSATGKRFKLKTNAVIDTQSGGNLSYLPGNAAGSIESGATYDQYVAGDVFLAGVLKGANFNSTADQAIPILYEGSYRVDQIIVTNASVDLSGSAAAGGFYTAASKSGTTLVANTQTYTGLTAPTKVTFPTFVSGTGNATVFSALQTLYLSLTTGHGSAATADVYVYIRRIPPLP